MGNVQISVTSNWDIFKSMSAWLTNHSDKEEEEEPELEVTNMAVTDTVYI